MRSNPPKKSGALRLSSSTARLVLAAAVALGAAVPVGAQAPQPAVLGAPPSALEAADEAPSDRVDAKGCAVVVGGTGGQFADPRATMVWHVANTEVTEYLHARMKLEDLRVVPLVLTLDQMRAPHQLVVDAMARHRCARVIHVAHEVGEDARGRHFTFKVSLRRLRSDAPRDAATRLGPAAMVGEFERAYRYPHDEKTLDTFRMSDLARQVYRDLEASGALGALRS